MLNEKDNKKFNPADFGFELYSPARGGSRKSNEDDYLILRKTKKGYDLNLSLSPDTSEFITELFGDRVNLYLNDKGYILVAEGKHLKVSAGAGNKEKCRHTISCSGLSKQFVERHGKFRRLYLDTTLYNHGNALLFKPNGEREDI